MKRNYAWAREFKIEDNSRASIPSEELMLPSASNNESLGLDGIGEQNLDNMMEG